LTTYQYFPLSLGLFISLFYCMLYIVLFQILEVLYVFLVGCWMIQCYRFYYNVSRFRIILSWWDFALCIRILCLLSVLKKIYHLFRYCIFVSIFLFLNNYWLCVGAFHFVHILNFSIFNYFFFWAR
jgi:hypothetical protein